MKIQISVSDELLARVDDFAKRTYMSRSAVFQQGALSYVSANETLAMLPVIQNILDNIDLSGEVSEEDLKTVEDYQNAVKLIRKTMVP